jgi:flagellar biosynthetic protein FliP
MGNTGQAQELLANQSLAPTLQLLLLLTILGLLPAIVLTMTSFVRTVVVLGFIRHGVSLQQSPPNQVIVGLALFLTMFTMAPVMDEIKVKVYEPYLAGQMTDVEALQAASVPLKRFMLRQTREADLRLFYDVTREPLPTTADDVPLRIAMPAFVISELTTAFQMGVMILLPFLVVDLTVASLLMSMGMMMVPPTTISLPLKILLFVLVDGWRLVAGALMRSFL